MLPTKNQRVEVMEQIVPGSTASQVLIAENPTRYGLKWMVIGSGSITVRAIPTGQAAPAVTFGSGMIYASDGANAQGSSEDFCGVAPKNGFAVAADMDTTIMLWEYIVHMESTIFVDGDPFNGVQGTLLTAAWLNTTAGELLNVITAAGIVPNGTVNNQLLAALNTRWATLASPAFIGTPTAPTQPKGDNSTKIATTAFVQTALSSQWLAVQAAIAAQTITPARLFFMSQS